MAHQDRIKQEGNIVSVGNSKWKVRNGIQVKHIKDKNYIEVTIDGNVYTFDTGDVVNIFSLIENHL